MARDIRRREEGEGLGGVKEAAKWRNLWNLNISGATKHFLWRACTNSLPTNALLLKKKVGKDDMCPICKSESETILHALWQCTAVNDVWACKGSGVQKWSVMVVDFMDLWDRLCMKMNSGLLEEVAMILKGIWNRRNKYVFENVFSSPAQVYEGAIHSLDGFRNALKCKKANSSGGCPVSVIKQWKKPEDGWLKANFDAAIDEQNGIVGLWIIIRNNKREVMAAYSEPQRMKTKAVVVEAIALRRTIEVCKEMGFNKVIFEGDALVIINTVKENVMCWTWYGQVVEDVKSSLKELLHWKILFVRRDGNMIAHRLAKFALNIGKLTCWIEECPVFISSLIAFDMACND
ncbi:hypothetical protein F2P56_031001 [Juglans regia]|uniref:Uncharacterized protein n=2 Tax=Juglans regia TaxID=51240 RepID=A0A833WZV6_JUGRE|nr:uncharacterized protein LOC109010825 [Juglans regia]KAF5450671.1 hypothetical protein F2P56_031001 [Juglans regia]